jgi:Nucleotidyl transferase AbiEii toxin, Type IV TA system
MIPMMNIVAWSSVVPWVDMRQVEQDLIISRAIVDIFSDAFLHGQLRVRGGTTLHKLHFPVSMRFSEDIDLVRTTSGPVGPVLARVREVLEPWLGHAEFLRSPVAPKLRFKTPAEDAATPSEIRVKVEINIWEIDAYDPPNEVEFRVDNPWFSGSAAVCTFSREEMLATKLRALLQRNKGRDLAAWRPKGKGSGSACHVQNRFDICGFSSSSRALGELRRIWIIAGPWFEYDKNKVPWTPHGQPPLTGTR